MADAQVKGVTGDEFLDGVASFWHKGAGTCAGCAGIDASTEACVVVDLAEEYGAVEANGADGGEPPDAGAGAVEHGVGDVAPLFDALIVGGGIEEKLSLEYGSGVYEECAPEIADVEQVGGQAKSWFDGCFEKCQAADGDRFAGLGVEGEAFAAKCAHAVGAAAVES